ncbi:MAG: cation-translocating P-type ATPase family protein, partial [Lentisphaeria bacterium]|nr:cation-translocating P-type ATPase family protein [Lentisphaeria bacterium]
MGIGHHHNLDGEGLPAGLLPACVVGLGMLLSATGAVPTVFGLPLAAVGAAVGSLPVLLSALRDLRRLRLSADLAVCLAAAAAIGIGEYMVAAEVILILLLGGVLEGYAVGRTRTAVRSLLALTPRQATRLRGAQRERVPIAALAAGDVVLVAPGERIPVDGRVEEGESTADHSALTGESLPVEVRPGCRALAGALNGHGVLRIVTEAVGPDTAFGRMLHLIEEAEHTRAPTQRLADRYAAYFLPVVLACAALTYFWSGELVRAVAVLVVACPCALVLATPTAISAGIGRLARRGILVKGGAALETLGRCRSVLLDKTGTLTWARLRLHTVSPAAGVSADTVLAAAAGVELDSEHPLGRAIVAEAGRRGLEYAGAVGVRSAPGRGICGTVGGDRVCVGSAALLAAEGMVVPAGFEARAESLRTEGMLVAFVGAAGSCLGLIGVRDEVRGEAREVVTALRRLFPGGVGMLTGDSAGAAAALGRDLGLAAGDVRSGLLPEDKARIVREAGAASGPVLMVGDGVNDAAALALADVGVAVTDLAADAAVAAADLVVLGDRPLRKLPEAVLFSRRVLRTIRQNAMVFAGGVNVLAVMAAGLGWVGPVAAAVLHQVSSLLVVLNSLRLLWRPEEVGGDLRRRVRQVGVAVWSARRPVLACGVAVYLCSGVFRVGPDGVGIVRRFGRVRTPLSGPGLHYRLPWPVTRLDRVRAGRWLRVEVGFRTTAGEQAGSPPAYEWNIQHRGGRYDMVPEEALMTCGDHSFLEVAAVAHFRIVDPVRVLCAAADLDAVLRTAAESALREVVSRQPLRAVLTLSRAEVEREAGAVLARILAPCETGVIPVAIHLQDVHPPLEVVDAFRRVVDALEQKDAVVSQAEAYANEQIPL